MAMQVPDDEVRKDACQTLSDIPMIAYENIMDYIPKVGEATQAYIQDSNLIEEAKEIMIFWIHLCQAEY